MAKLLASSQITIVDLNDAVSLQSYITSTHPRVQFLNNNGTYIPNYNSENVTLNAELYKMGNNTNLVTSPGTEVSNISWFVKVAPSLEYVKITPEMGEYELIGSSPFYRGVKIKNNIMNASKPGATFKCEITFKEAWMEDPHIQTTEIDFSLTIQGNDGADSYTSILTNDNHSILCSNSGIPDIDEIGIGGRAYSDTLAYKGTQALTAVSSNPGIGQYSISIAGENCTAIKADNDTFYINALSSTNALINEDGVLDEDTETSELDTKIVAKNISNGGKVKVTFNLEGVTTMVKYMTWAKVLHGADGSNGLNGADGESAKYITLSIKEGSNVFKYEKNSTTPDILKTILQANTFNINNPTYTWSYFANGSWANIAGQTSSTLTINHNDSYFNLSNSITFRCTTINNLTDEITITKLVDGSDSISIQSSNESHVIACTYDGAFKAGESDRATNTITAYKGADALTHTTSTPGKGQFKISVEANEMVDFTVTNNTIKILDMDADSTVLIISVNCEGILYKKTMSLSKAKDGREGVDGYVATLTNEFHSLPASSTGSVTSYSGCSSSIELYKGAEQITSGVTYSAVANTGVTGSMSGNTYTVTGLSVDSSSVNLTATYNGRSYSKVFTITKNKQGQAGTNGQNANSYWIIPSSTSVHKDKQGVLNPTSLKFDAKVQSGNNALQSYSGRFKIYTSTDGAEFTASYTSSANESTKTISVPTDAKAIKCELYLAGGTSTLLDVQTVYVTTDGADGQDGQDGAPASYVMIHGENVFKYAGNFVGAPVPSSITLTRTLFNATGGKWQYHNGSAWVDFSPAQTGSTLEVTPTLGHFSTSSNKVMRVRYYINNNIVDEMSIAKIADGSNAYTVVLSNPSHSCVAGHDGVVSSTELAKATTDVIVYKGSDKINTATISNGVANPTTAKFTVTAGTSTTAPKITLTTLPNNVDAATYSFDVTVDGQILKQIFTVSKAKQGTPGNSAKVLQITGGSTIVFKQDGTKDPANGVVLTAIKKNTTGTVVWKNGSTQLATGDTYTVPVTALNSTTNYTVRAEISGDTSVYDTHTIHKIMDGTNAITSYLWCPNGNAIKNNSMTEVAIEAVIFNGGSNVTTSSEAKYHWQKKVGSNWVDIKGSSSSPVLGNNGGSTINISQDDIPSMLVVRCNMQYKTTTQTDSIVIEDIVDPVQATIYSTAGDTFKNSIGETFLIAKTIRNGEEIDYIRLVDSITGITGSQGELVFSKLDKKYYKYNNSSWTSVGTISEPPTTDFVFDYNWTKSDKDGNLISNWSKTGKILYVQSNEVSQKAIFMVDVEE